MGNEEKSDKRRCPGEDYDITPAICRARQRNRYPKCLLCEWQDLGRENGAESDPRVPADIFRQSQVLGEVSSEVDQYVMRKVGGAAAQLLRAAVSRAGRIVLGHDLRGSSRRLARALGEGITHGGLDAVRGGFMPQEVLKFALATSNSVGGAYVTGGNEAEGLNGARLFDSSGRQLDFESGLDKVGLISRRRGSGRSRSPGSRSFIDPMDDYRSCVQKFVPEMQDCTVMVNGAAGLAGRTVPFVSDGLPARIVKQNLDSQGGKNFLGDSFPAERACRKLKRGMKTKDTDLGAAFDYPADRICFFDETGGRVRHDVASTLLARELLRRHGGGVMVYDLRASAVFRQAISEAGGKAVSSPVGQLAVARQMRQTDALYGTDLTGRHYFKGFFRSNSPVLALLLMCSIVSRSEKTMSELVAEVNRYHHSGEIKVKTSTAKAAREALERVDRQYQDAERERKDGLTVRFQKWWFNLRHVEEEPELRLNVEGRTSEDERAGRREVLKLVERASRASRQQT